jgi:DNA helicase-2/ATP-dependent DNA helicase PcrA
MKFYADLHIHSPYSRATSSRLSLEELYASGRIKGIQVIGTGDCLHPARLAECREKLKDEGTGLFTLKQKYCSVAADLVPQGRTGEVRFMPTVEVSCIYRRSGRVRKVHNVICFPSIDAALRARKRLEKIGNLNADGRPIIGLDSRNLLEIALEADPAALFIPAHIWTPWFSVLGSKSGFDSIGECFGDLTRHIYAVETGLSSDPAMNRRLSSLDPFALVSFSDAHSPAKLGRECTLFDTDLSYPALYRALAEKKNPGLAGTVEFFPEEGKYHVDGHRTCGVRFTPKETAAAKGCCPVCGRQLTVGVLSRVEELADRREAAATPKSRPYRNLIPLREVIAESLDCGGETKKATQAYERIIAEVGSEFSVLLDAPIADIAAAGGEVVAEGVRRMRKGEVNINPGFDGEFGTIELFTADERGNNKTRSGIRAPINS